MPLNCVEILFLSIENEVLERLLHLNQNKFKYRYGHHPLEWP
jgi:hypothetical protein